VSGPAGLPSIGDAAVPQPPEIKRLFSVPRGAAMLGTLHLRCVDYNPTCSGAKRERGRAGAGLPVAGAVV